MESELILKTFECKLITQRYAHNTVKAYMDYARLFFKHVNDYTSIKAVPMRAIESFINKKVENEQISSSYQKGLVGAIKKIYELILNEKIQLDYPYPKNSNLLILHC